MTRENSENLNVSEKSAAGAELSRDKTLTAQALRALEEAAARRRAASAVATPQEIGGRGGLEPTRYGDWEKKGIASDF
jgi:hypothetical protein